MVTGKPISASSLADADYWVRNMTSPVQFVSAVEHLIDTVVSKGKRTTTAVGGDHNAIMNKVELGPHPAMQTATKEIVEANPIAAGRVSYSWALQRNTSAMAQDHVITGQLIYTGAAYLVMAIQAVKALVDSSSTANGFRLRDVAFETVLQIQDTTEALETMMVFRRKPESSYSTSSIWFEFKIFSYQKSLDGWTEYCTGLIAVEYGNNNNPIVTDAPSVAIRQSFETLKSRASQECTVPVDIDIMRMYLDSLGMVFGPTMRGLTSASRGNGTGQALGIVRIPNPRQHA
ncbi:Acyl transferase/acyl hydrolase/lysophospholipase [Penicillium mononematosum]|uniref:Acyl transferase/acyl hydrolase/lysophospholipase n=1 Tax=Penicillium mononematosum TaxID=268346 RepID=UPI0025470323|nr:Acyl transferase/acyl hydrolase/lysophospholipase [Penicillium mononematosum]KAJ6191689.1 Acyl transferase/acyl hydrolase/lysophospholipase [Penicillium mononematosum]